MDGPLSNDPHLSNRFDCRQPCYQSNCKNEIVWVYQCPKQSLTFFVFQGTKKTKRSDVESILEPESLTFFEKLGDWVVIYLVVRNLNNLVVNDLLYQLHKEEQGKNFNGQETLKLKDGDRSSAV